MLSCSKTISDIPFAHRQHKHDGHCAQIHGHNWTFKFTFKARVLDECGFVVDFGKLKFLRTYLEATFDHALVLNASDPALPHLRESLAAYARIIVVDDCSCEGLLEHLYPILNQLVADATNGRVYIARLEIEEDTRNSAAYEL